MGQNPHAPAQTLLNPACANQATYCHPTFPMKLTNRLHRFIGLVHRTHQLPPAVLMHIVSNLTSYSPLYRAAALRCLIGSAPLSVTGGQPYLARRRAVRLHYGV